MSDETLPVEDSAPSDLVQYHIPPDGCLTPPVVACFDISKAYSINEVADALGVDERTIRQWVETGELNAINVNRDPHSRKPRLRILEEDVVAFTQQRQQGVEKTNPTTRRARKLPAPERIV